MKSRLIVFISVLIIAFLSTLSVQACSSFALYSDEVIYGANFDFDDNPRLKFAFEGDAKDFRFLTLRFNFNGYYAHMCGMNNKGLFGTVQMVPGKAVTPVPGEQTITTYDLLLSSLKRAETIDQVKQILGNKRLIHLPMIDLHCMFADRYGRVLVVEVGTEQNHIYENKDNHFVMTNFNFSDNEGKAEESISGFGADRYRTGLAELRTHMLNFNSDIAMQTLAKMSQPVTLSSMVFLPEKNRAYIALNRNYDRLWEVDLTKETISAFEGFHKPRTEKLTAITNAKLESWQ